MTFDQYYSDVPADQREGLRQFRQAHPAQTTTVAGTRWTYYTAGTPQKTAILWLVGGIKVADIAYDMIPLLQDDHFIIAPDYPPLETIDALADGLAGVLSAEDVTQVNVLAGSFGGMLAQAFLRRHPERARKVVLSTTTAPDPDTALRYQRQLTLARFVPEPILRGQAKKQMYDTIAPPDAKAAFYRAYLDELYSERLGKADILSLYRALVDYLQRDYSADDVRDWDGEMLILASDDDATFDESARQALLRLYPQARTHLFSGAGHSPATTQRAEFFRVVRGFFDT